VRALGLHDALRWLAVAPPAAAAAQQRALHDALRRLAAAPPAAAAAQQ